MNALRCFALIAAGSMLSLAACDKKPEPAPAGATPSTGHTDATPVPPAADNTAANRTDAATNAKTPMDQSQSRAGIKVTADIRRAIMNDGTMSMNAQNCKIITDEAGLVTLRGVVNSQMEKDSIGAKAVAVAGVTKVDNQLEVKVN